MQSKKMVRQKWMRSNSAPPRLSNLRVKRRTPTEHVGWRSTETVLKCSANGGANGGLVRIEVEGADSLVQYNGKPLPYLKFLEPNETISFKNRYRAVKASNVANDIKVTATFVENETGWTQEKTDEATAVKVEIRPRVFAPENECAFRHRFGIGEVVGCKFFPGDAPVAWKASGRGTFSSVGCVSEYSCPLYAEAEGIGIGGNGVSYYPKTVVLEPEGVLTREVGYRESGVSQGDAGGILLTMTLHALPLEVSFQNVKIEEVPDAGGSHTGYFADSFFMSEWYHGKKQGAGVWRAVVSDNKFLNDEAGLTTALPQVDEHGFVSLSGASGWRDGCLTWIVPCGWGANSVSEDEDPVGVFAAESSQVMSIDEDGTCEVRKHSNMVRRSADGLIHLNGVQKK